MGALPFFVLFSPKKDVEANALCACLDVEAESGNTWTWNEKIEERARDWKGRNGSFFLFIKIFYWFNMNPCYPHCHIHSSLTLSVRVYLWFFHCPILNPCTWDIHVFSLCHRLRWRVNIDDMNFADCGLHIRGSHTDARFNAICGLLRVMV